MKKRTTTNKEKQKRGKPMDKELALWILSAALQQHGFHVPDGVILHWGEMTVVKPGRRRGK